MVRSADACNCSVVEIQNSKLGSVSHCIKVDSDSVSIIGQRSRCAAAGTLYSPGGRWSYSSTGVSGMAVLFTQPSLLTMPNGGVKSSTPTSKETGGTTKHLGRLVGQLCEYGSTKEPTRPSDESEMRSTVLVLASLLS